LPLNSGLTVAEKTRDLLTREMRKAGLSNAAIDAAWPTWWTDEAEESPSSRAELRFTLARRLGLSPRSLLGERVEFFWDDAARFKHLRVHDGDERAAIASFGIALGRELILATAEPPGLDWRSLTAEKLRESLLRSHQFVDLQALVAACWSFGVPIVQLGVVPLESKSMHAMVVQDNGRFAILLARNARYPAMAAFTVAHEIAHILLGHLDGARALVDLESSVEVRDEDKQEVDADSFALKLLTGAEQPIIRPDIKEFNAPTLANASMAAGALYRVEPGTIALALAYRDGSWARTMSALKFIYGEIDPVSKQINSVARHMLDWGALTEESADYLHIIITDANV
jgi:hypothetical protein